MHCDSYTQQLRCYLFGLYVSSQDNSKSPSCSWRQIRVKQ